jgi:hypothetical protein
VGRTFTFATAILSLIGMINCDNGQEHPGDFIIKGETGKNLD